jgi:hypothetical protein
VGLPVELAKITGLRVIRGTALTATSLEPTILYRTATSRTVHDYLTYVRQFEAADRGAGQLSEHSRTQPACPGIRRERLEQRPSQGEIHVEIEEETCDVRKWLAGKDLTTASRNELLGFEKECDEAVQAIMDAKSRARVIRLRSEMSNGAGK